MHQQCSIDAQSTSYILEHSPSFSLNSSPSSNSLLLTLHPISSAFLLTDPLYFDFISYAQFAVIGQEVPSGQQVFKVRAAAA